MYVLIIRNYSYLEKKVLIANRSQGHSFILNGQTFFCFNCLVESVTPTPPLTFKKPTVIIMPSKNQCDLIMQQDRRMRQRERERERERERGGKEREKVTALSCLLYTRSNYHQLTANDLVFKIRIVLDLKKNGISLNNG